MIESISAVTLATRDMARAVDLYRRLGFELAKGGADAPFTSLPTGGRGRRFAGPNAASTWRPVNGAVPSG